MYHKFFKKTTTLIFLLIFLVANFIFLPSAKAIAPNDFRYDDQKIMYNQINAPLAWNFTTGNKRVVVAIIDTGVDTEHRDLKNNIWSNPFEIPDNYIDDDNNGYVDDVNGWNFVNDNNVVRPSVLDTKDDPEAIRHGTIVAGLIGAIGNNQIDGVGLNWSVRIMPLVAVDSQGNGSYTSVTEAIKYAVNNGADIITMSFVGETSDINLQSAITYAYKNGVMVVAAAGNNQRLERGDTAQFPVYPLCMDGESNQNEILGVGAIAQNNFLSDFSNFGTCVDIYAPGEEIFSTERYAPRYDFNDEFGGPWQGTSFATPLVAGTAALIKSLRPLWDVDQIYQTILNTVSTTIVENRILKILNTGAALQKAATAFEVPFPRFTRGTRNVGGQIFLRGIDGYPDKLVLTIYQAKVLWSQDFVFDYGKRKGVLVLSKREKYYYLDWQEIDGVNFNEYSIGGGANRKINKVVILPGYPIETALVEEYNNKSKRTVFKEFNYFGKKLHEVTVAGTVKNWVFNGGVIKYTQTNGSNGKLTTKTIKWYNND